MENLSSEFPLEEENELLQYIIKNNKYPHLQQEQFWEEIEKLNVIKGTWLKWKHHFENKIVHKLKHPRFKLKKDEIDKLLSASFCVNENTDSGKDIQKSQSAPITVPSHISVGKKIIVITRKKNNVNTYPNYKTEGHKRILVSRHKNPPPGITYTEENPGKPRKTIVASFCAGKKKEIFVVRPKDEEPFERHGTVSNKGAGQNNPPKKLICFSYDVT